MPQDIALLVTITHPGYEVTTPLDRGELNRQSWNLNTIAEYYCGKTCDRSRQLFHFNFATEWLGRYGIKRQGTGFKKSYQNQGSGIRGQGRTIKILNKQCKN